MRVGMLHGGANLFRVHLHREIDIHPMRTAIEAGRKPTFLISTAKDAFMRQPLGNCRARFETVSDIPSHPSSRTKERRLRRWVASEFAPFHIE